LGGGSRFFVYGQIDTQTERLREAKSRVSGKFETTGDRIKCRLEMLRETTNWYLVYQEEWDEGWHRERLFSVFGGIEMAWGKSKGYSSLLDYDIMLMGK